MHDLRAIRAAPEAFDAAMARRGIGPVAGEILVKDEARKALITKLQTLQSERNARSKRIGELVRAGHEAEAAQLRAETGDALDEGGIKDLDAAIKAELEILPNVLDPDVPDGADDTANVVIAQHGEPRDLGFQPREHFELGEALGMMDFAAAAKMSGSRFVVLRGPLAHLERALGQFMLDLHTREHGYTEMAVPTLVNEAAMYGTDKLPKFRDEQFLTDDERFFLIATAEIPLTFSVASETLAEKQLPIRITALTDCFRKEAGAAGRDTRGMLRQHQFRKVELVSITHPDRGAEEHERMTRCAETVLRLLELPFRRVLLCAGDTGFGAAKTFDLEVWLPGQHAWREISSCSNTRDFQARRMNARMRPADGKGLAFVHTLNGSGVALGRALIAVMETHQQADGSILIPRVLWPYMGGVERIATA
ncbi:MAG: serine--tRNA ligase [Acetobacteraceae bacterium]